MLATLVAAPHRHEWDDPNPTARQQRRRWTRQVGAELATLAKLNPSSADGDRVVLICSDTADSVFCAMQIWEACNSWKWTSSSSRESDVHVLTGLTPDNPFDFERAIRVDLYELLKSLAEGLAPSDELIFIGSGGYKAAAGLYYFNLASLPSPPSRALVFLYEESDDCIVYRVPFGWQSSDTIGQPLPTSSVLASEPDRRPELFISYSFGDRASIDDLYRKLACRGVQAWMAECEVPPGSKWYDEVEKGIKASRAAIICIGGKGLTGWQKNEMLMLIADPDHERLVIPVILPDVAGNPELPLLLQARQWVDLRKGDTDPVEQILQAMRDGGVLRPRES
jgi:hypothetical protein